MSEAAFFRVSDLAVEITSDGARVRPVDGVSLALAPGTIMGLVGESGSGKSLTCRAVMGLLPENIAPTVSGTMLIDGHEFDLSTRSAVHGARDLDVAMIFQNPASFLDPLMPIWRQIAEPLIVRERMPRARARVEALSLMRRVGLPDPEGNARAFPHQLSGGMKQRVMIAAALACRPKLLIADEPTTALDVTVQMQILQLLLQLKRDTNLAIILVTHDLAVVSMICDSISVMYCGKIVEMGPRADLLGRPAHPYTRALLDSQPDRAVGGERLRAISGQLPPLTDLPRGCRYHPRCPYAIARCRAIEPELEEIEPNHIVACHRARELLAGDVRTP